MPKREGEAFMGNLNERKGGGASCTRDYRRVGNRGPGHHSLEKGREERKKIVDPIHSDTPGKEGSSLPKGSKELMSSGKRPKGGGEGKQFSIQCSPGEGW